MTPRCPCPTRAPWLLLALLCALFWTAPARAAAPIGLAKEPRGFGLGVILGEPTGLCAAWRGSGDSTYDMAVAWSVPDHKVHFHADYLHQLVSFRDPASPAVEFPVYVGVGPRVRLGDEFQDGSSSILALRLPVGLAIQGGKVPVEGFVEAVPVLVLYSDTRLDFDAAIGVRVYFSSRLERVDDSQASPEATP